MISSLLMSGLFSQVFSLSAEPVYLGNGFYFSSSYSRGKQSMSSCVLQQLLANKTVLVQFFPGSFASKFEMTQILFVPRFCRLSFASRFIGCWLWFHNSLILCCCTSLEILSVVLPIRFFFLFLMSSNRLKQLLQTRLWSSFTNGNCTVVWSIAFKALNSTGRDKA